MSTARGETKFFKIKQVCHSTPQRRRSSTEVCYQALKEEKKKRPRKVILTVKQLSLIKPVLTPKVEISDELFLPLFLFSLTSNGSLAAPGSPQPHVPRWNPTRQCLGAQCSRSERRSFAPHRSAAAVTRKRISGVFNTQTKALLFDVSHKLFPLLMVKHIHQP